MVDHVEALFPVLLRTMSDNSDEVFRVFLHLNCNVYEPNPHSGRSLFLKIVKKEQLSISFFIGNVQPYL